MGCGAEEKCITTPARGEAKRYTGSAATESKTEYRDEDEANAKGFPNGTTQHQHIFVSGTNIDDAPSFHGLNVNFVEGAGASKTRSADELKAISKVYKDKIATPFKGVAGNTASTSIAGGSWASEVSEARQFLEEYPSWLSEQGLA